MKPIRIDINEFHGVSRNGYMIEQGVPVPGISPEQTQTLGVIDESGNSVSANVQIEHIDPTGKVRWMLVSLPVDVAANSSKTYYLAPGSGEPAGSTLTLHESSNGITIKTDCYTAIFTNPGHISLATDKGTIIDGTAGFTLLPDARSKVGNCRPLYYEPLGFEIIEQSPKRVHLLLKGVYRSLRPKDTTVDPVQRYDADAEFIIYADSPVIKFRWIITNFLRFNCSYMWLLKYTFSLPLAEGSAIVAGDEVPGEDKFGRWATVSTPGGNLAMTFPFYGWLGKGAGIEVSDGRIAQGGINPPVDGGFGGKSPDIWRKFYYGMSRSFEGALLIGPSQADLESELNPLAITLNPQHYSECSELPEDGSRVTFGPWKDIIDRTADGLIENQWKGTLWFGEWWREWDIDMNMGVEETNSGNSAMGPLYHFYRTGDYRFFESAKMSYYYTYDLQFCKQEDGFGPYMHTRRFLLDHQEWFHPRYQRVGGMIRCSHFFGDKVYRDKVIWFLRYWGENYVAEDGAPLTPNRDGTKNKCTESAMSNFADSLIYAYLETGDKWFLDKAKLIGDWVVHGVDNVEGFLFNNNDTRYIMRGLLPLCQITGEQKYINTYCKIARWTARRQEEHNDYVTFHIYYLSQGYKWCGDQSLLDAAVKLAEWTFSRENKDNPGTFPFGRRDCTNNPTRWRCHYASKALVSYLPVLASTLEEARE